MGELFKFTIAFFLRDRRSNHFRFWQNFLAWELVWRNWAKIGFAIGGPLGALGGQVAEEATFCSFGDVEDFDVGHFVLPELGETIAF